MRRAVVDLRSARPLWSIPRPDLKTLRRAFGHKWRVIEVRATSSSDGDGGKPSAEACRAAVGAEVYIGWGVAPQIVEAAAGSLRWIHTAAAGVGGSLSDQLAESGTVLTNSRGVHAEPMADWAVGAIAFCVRGFHDAVAAQRRRRWAKDRFTDGSVRLIEFDETRVGIIGLGGVGRAIAKRCHALGMTVRGVRRRPERRRPAGVQWVGSPRDLVRLARQSDVLVIAAPHTDATVKVVNAKVLRALPSGAFVINLARGPLVDEKALLRYIDEGALGGAVLDVMTTEPLPPRHPFWSHDRVFITPHVSGASRRFWRREVALVAENVRRYLEGRRLQNVVNQREGY